VIRLSKAGVPGAVIEIMRDPKRVPVEANGRNNDKGKDNKGKDKKTTAVAVVPPAPVAPPPTQPAQTKATTPITAPPPVKPAATAVPVTIGDALPFSIRLAEDVPADAEDGRILHFTVVDGLKVGDNVVIAKGAAVYGSILDAGKKKAFGLGSKTAFRLTQADAVDGKKLAVRAEPARKEGAKRPLDSGAKGKTKEIAAAAGSQYVAYIDGNQSVLIRK
jgi:hypothetical protein